MIFHNRVGKNFLINKNYEYVKLLLVAFIFTLCERYIRTPRFFLFQTSVSCRLIIAFISIYTRADVNIYDASLFINFFNVCIAWDYFPLQLHRSFHFK